MLHCDSSCLNYFSFFHLLGPVYYCHHPHRPVLFHGGLQVPVSSLSVHHYELWVHLSAALSPFLVPSLHKRSEAAQNCEKWNLQKQRPLKFKHNLNLWKRLIPGLPWQSRYISTCSAFCIFFKIKSLYFYDKLWGFLIFESWNSQITQSSDRA